MNERELVAFELGYDTAMYGQNVPEDAPERKGLKSRNGSSRW